MNLAGPSQAQQSFLHCKCNLEVSWVAGAFPKPSLNSSKDGDSIAKQLVPWCDHPFCKSCCISPIPNSSFPCTSCADCALVPWEEFVPVSFYLCLCEMESMQQQPRGLHQHPMAPLPALWMLLLCKLFYTSIPNPWYLWSCCWIFSSYPEPCYLICPSCKKRL